MRLMTNRNGTENSMVILHNHNQRPKTCVKNRVVGTALRPNYAVEIKDIAEALITSGFTSRELSGLPMSVQAPLAELAEPRRRQHVR